MTDIVNVGSAANSGTGDALRSAFAQINARFQELLGTLSGRGTWTTATLYTATPAREWVINGGIAYVATVNHTSGATFAADLGAGKWLAADAVQNMSDLAAAGGSALVSFLQTGAGAGARSLQTKGRESRSVADYTGADSTGAADSYAAFLAAITALPATGGVIKVPPGLWRLNTLPAWGTKSVVWDIDPGATFIGAGTAATSGAGYFPSMFTNPAQVAVGPWVRSQSSTPSPAGGGIAAFNIEMLQPSSYVGQSVGLYVGAKGSGANAGSNVWAINPLIRAEAGALGTYQCIEVDVDCFSSSALMKGISISGAGSANPDVALEVVRAAGTWDRGVHILNAQDAIVIAPVSGGRGIAMNNPAGINDTALSAKQFVNNADMFFLQRNTDAAPTGYFFRAVNAANNVNLLTIDVLGNLVTPSIVQAGNSRLTLGANPGVAGQWTDGATTQSTVSGAGGAAALPATPLGYKISYNGTTKVGTPYYAIP